MKLHEKQDEFIAAIQSAAVHKKIPDYIVEKDYWVTKALKQLSQSKDLFDAVVFKGGTSLSKGYNLINRFSEDIDLALFPSALGKKGFSKNKHDSLYQVINAVRPIDFEQNDDFKVSQEKRYKRVFKFPTNLNYPPESPIHPRIVIEATLFGDPNPTEKLKISSVIGEWLAHIGRLEEIVEFELEPFLLKVATPEKTFCEKILSVMKRAEESEVSSLGIRVRHLYDIYRLANSNRIKVFLEDKEKFYKYFIGAVETDTYFKQLYNDKGLDPLKYKIFNERDKVLDSIKSSYNKLDEIIFDDSLPSLVDIGNCLETIAKKMKLFNLHATQI